MVRPGPYLQKQPPPPPRPPLCVAHTPYPRAQRHHPIVGWLPSRHLFPLTYIIRTRSTYTHDTAANHQSSDATAQATRIKPSCALLQHRVMNDGLNAGMLQVLLLNGGLQVLLTSGTAHEVKEYMERREASLHFPPGFVRDPRFRAHLRTACVRAAIAGNLPGNM